MFDLARVQLNTSADEKALTVKLSPTTDVFAMVAEVSRAIPSLSGPKVVRLLIKVGYAAFLKSERERAVL